MTSTKLARIAGAFYVLTFITGIAAYRMRGPIGVTAGMIASVCYLAVTVLFYKIFKPVNRTVSLIAAIVSVGAIVYGVLMTMKVVPNVINNLVFFGVYCLLIGWLIWRSTFLPRFLGALMMIAGLGWLTYASPSLTSSLAPFNALPGFIGEGVLTIWLVAAGVNAQRWQEQGGAA